jgi:hypothetical protein
MDIKDIKLEGVDWTNVAQYGDRQRTVLNTIKHLMVP